MSDIDTDEAPEDIGEQLLIEEFLERPAVEPEAERLEREREEEAYRRELEREPPEYEPTILEADLMRKGLGDAFGYVVYYSSPSDRQA